MRFDNYLNEYNLIPQYILLFEDIGLNEIKVTDPIFTDLKNLGKKVGIRLKRSDSIFTYLKDAGKKAQDLIRFASLYLLTDITDNKSRGELVSDAKRTMKNMDKKEMIAFMFQLDKATVGITAHLRHVMQSIFGLEVATYNKWLNDVDYLKKEIRHIKTVLKRMGDKEKELEVVKKLENMVFAMEEL